MQFVRSMWKQVNTSCLGCSRENVEHYAKGLCKNCYDAWRRQIRMFNAGKTENIRRPFCLSCGARPVKRHNPPACASCLALNRKQE